MSKASGVITENLLLKYQKQEITAVLNGQYNQSNIKNSTLMLLPTVLRKSWIYQMLPFIVSWGLSPIWNKVPDREFTEVPIMNFIPVWESEIVNQVGL